MEDPATATSAITSAVADMGPQLLAVGAIGLGIGVTIFVLTKGWGLVKRFSK